MLCRVGLVVSLVTLVTLARGAPNLPRSYLPPREPECRTVTEEQDQEVQEEECSVTEAEKCDTGTNK